MALVATLIANPSNPVLAASLGERAADAVNASGLYWLADGIACDIALRDGTDEATARGIGMAQWIGSAAVASRRLRGALGIPGNDVEAVLKVLQLHPAFLPGYLRFELERVGPARGRLTIADCDALAEGDAFSWYALFDVAPHPALDAMVHAVNPRARCVPVTPRPGARFAWDVVIDAAAEPAALRPEVGMVEATDTARFAFVDSGVHDSVGG